MLKSIDLNDKSYEELLSEAMAQIPIYSSEWTNFNVSDPGITVLQNLTAFNVLQQEQLSEVSDAIRRRLIALIGIEPSDNVPPGLLVQAPKSDEGLTLPRHYTLSSGSLTFETTSEIALEAWSIKASYIGGYGEYRNVSRFLENPRTAVEVFGHNPSDGCALYCILDGNVHAGSILRFWVQVPEDSKRIPFSSGDDAPAFAKTRWQYYTPEGWVDVETKDSTHAFLSSGEVELALGELPPILFPETPVYGPAVRCLLCESEYDTPPRILTLHGNLFPVYQQKTGASTFVLPAGSSVEIHSDLAALGNLFVYCRESGNDDYYAYEEASPSQVKYGRYYRLYHIPDGVRIEFDEAAFGCSPAEGDDSVLVCCYDNEMIYHRVLGTVYGYEEQTLNIDLVSGIVPGSFSVLAEIPAQDGEAPVYRRIFPGLDTPDELSYSILQQENKILIHHPAYSGTYTLILSDCVTTQGKSGNIRFGTNLNRLGGYDGTDVLNTFFAPSPGIGGMRFETSEELRRRFSAKLRKVNTAVTAEDYETTAKSVPGLAIHKVKAVIKPKDNLVNLAVKPYTNEERPSLSALYIRALRSYMDERRMLTTRVELISPKYVRIDVSAGIVVKPHYENAREEIENALRASLDYVTTDVPFGSWIRFSSIFDIILRLPCVVRVDSLRLIPEDRSDVTVSSSDLKLSDRALCYAGDISLDLNTFSVTNR